MAKKKDNDKYNEPVKVDATGFSFDEFVGAVAGADPHRVQDKIALLEALESLIKSNERVIHLLQSDRKESIDGCRAQISRARQTIDEIKSGL